MSTAWRPSATRAMAAERARMLKTARAFFEARAVLEVETPAVIQRPAVEPHITSFKLRDDPRFLHVSPELAMKRLLAAGYGDIYQLTKVFRANESGRLHNPEFTMLEWYRLGLDLDGLMAEVKALLTELLAPRSGAWPTDYIRYRQVFERYCGFDPLQATRPECAEAARRVGIETGSGLSCSDYLDLLMARVIAPALPADRLTFIVGYPENQAAMARLRDTVPPVAERFEVFAGALELANGYWELTDSTEQCRRLERDQAAEAIDTRFRAAVESGLPDCAGVAVGIDRVLMLATSACHINEVLTFPWELA